MACAYKCRPPSLHALFRHRGQGVVDVLVGMTPEEREAAVSDHYIEAKCDYGSIGSLCA